MADLIFYYGPMGCSKTANALMARHNALSLGKHVWLIKPAVDTRDDKVSKDGKRIPIIRSRVGIEAEAEAIYAHDNINPPPYTELIICDEAQFLKEFQVDELNEIAKDFDIPVLCYGLRTDFRTSLFHGSSRLFEIADRLVELETFCECGKKAVLTAKFEDGK
jgi:thymidine kinase